MVAIGRETWYMCHRKPITGHILDWKTNELQKMAQNIYDCIIFKFSYGENLGVQIVLK